ncbi:uncharacterized protein TNCV_4929771 [Trichonephila clavipes]|nr:uncharacterized protein TNCV_4929771 [Trichonephila clavipes]
MKSLSHVRFNMHQLLQVKIQNHDLTTPTTNLWPWLPQLQVFWEIRTCRPARNPKLTPAIKAKRLNWTKQWRDKDEDFWRSVCFSDESTFEILRNKAQFVRRRRGEKFHSDWVVQTVKHSITVLLKLSILATQFSILISSRPPYIQQ